MKLGAVISHLNRYNIPISSMEPVVVKKLQQTNKNIERLFLRNLRIIENVLKRNPPYDRKVLRDKIFQNSRNA